MQLLAGDIPPGSLTGPAPSPFASIVSAGTIDTTGYSLTLSGGAIDMSAGTVRSGALQANIVNAPFSFQGDDDGLLVNGCLEGDICIGALVANGSVFVGNASPQGVVSLIVGTATIVNADVIDIATNESLTIGSIVGTSSLDAASDVSLVSSFGDVELTDVSINAPQIVVDASNGSLLGTGRLFATGDIGVSVANDLFADTIDAGGQLTTATAVGGAAETSYDLSGTFSVDTFIEGGPSDMVVNAGTAISIGFADPGGQAVVLTTPGSLFLGESAVDVASVTLNGSTVDFNTINAIGDVTATASAGAIAGTANGDITAGGTIDLLASDIISVGTLSAGSGVILDGASIDFTAISTSTGVIDLMAPGGITGGDVIGGGAGDLVIIDSGAVLTLGDVVSGGDVVLQADTIAAGDVTAPGAIQIDGGSLSAGLLDAGADLAATVAAAANVGGIVTGGDAALNTGSLTLGGGDIGGALNAATSTGDLAVTGALAIGGDAAFDSAGSLSLTVLSSGGDVSASSATGTDFDGIDATGDAAISAGGAVTGGSLFSDRLAEVSAGGLIGLVDLSALDADLASGGAITVGDALIDNTLIASGQSLDVGSSSDLTVQATATGGDVVIGVAGDLSVIDAVATGNVQLTSLGGSVVVAGAGAGVTFTPNGVFAPQQVTASSGDVSITAASDILVQDTIFAGNAIFLNAQGLVGIDALLNGQFIDIAAGDIDIGTGGSLGNSGRTGGVAITALRDALIGGAGGTGTAFELDNDELSRISNDGVLAIATDISPTGAIPTLTLGDAELVAGQQFGVDSGLVLTSGSSIFVHGTVTIDSAGADTFLLLDAVDAVDLDYETASISVRDTDGLLTGTIDLQAASITFLSDAARSDIAGIPGTAVNDRLSIADGARDAPLFQTGNLSLSASDAILVQNTGLGQGFDDRRGLVAETLTIAGSLDGTTLVVINGIIGGQTGIAAIDVTTQASGFAPGSTINGCPIGDIAICGPNAPMVPMPGPTDPLPEFLFPIQNIIDEELRDEEQTEDGVADGDEADARGGQDMLIDISDLEDPSTDPLIDDPVTGAGNEDLWQPPE